MPARRTGWIGAALALGFVVVLTPPLILFWNAIQPDPWDAHTIKIRYQAVRYEAGGLVFRYAVQNLTHRTARFFPDSTQIRALQSSDRPPVGYPNLRLPLELPADSVQQVEIRLELPGTRMSMLQEQSDEQTKMVLQHKPAGTPPDNDAPVSPLPMRGKIAANEKQPPPQPTFSFDDSLSDLQGFELSDTVKGVKLVFPRGW